MKNLRNIAILGNALFILWMAFNAMDEGFHGVGRVELASVTGLTVLLAINVVLLWRQK